MNLWYSKDFHLIFRILDVDLLRKTVLGGGGHFLRLCLNFSFAATSSAVIPGSFAEWPASATICFRKRKNSYNRFDIWNKMVLIFKPHYVVEDNHLLLIITLSSDSGHALWRSHADIIGQHISYLPCYITNKIIFKVSNINWDYWLKFKVTIVFKKKHQWKLERHF